jgi:4-hydroxybenzoate polyprenyltransferase
MWPEMYEFAVTTLAVAFCGAAIKLTDDYLDQEEDRQLARWNWTVVLGVGTPVYAMLLLALAAATDVVVSLSLFLASYVVGMLSVPERAYPCGLRGWQECGLILFAGTLLLGFRSMAFALTFVMAVQLIDDCVDRKLDACQTPVRGNWANRLGMTECLLAAAILLLTALEIGRLWFWPTLTVATVLYITGIWQERKGWR